MHVPSQDKLVRVAAERAFSIKWGNDRSEDINSSDWVASRQIFCASASVIYLCTIKSRRW